jgi:hypothetical protein
MEAMLMGIEPNVNLPHFYEFVTIVPISLLFLANLWTLSNSSNKTNVAVSEEPSFVMKIWSVILFLPLVMSFIRGETISPVVFLTSLMLMLSALVVSHPMGQKMYHIGSSCSWIGCFDLYVRTVPQENFGHFLYWKWVVAFVMATSVVMRGHLSNRWQYCSLPFMAVGIPMISLYYWGFEMPMCDMMGDSMLSCDFSHGPPPRLASCGLDDHYRILGLISIIVIHFLYGQMMAVCFVEDCREDRSASELEKGAQSCCVDDQCDENCPTPKPDLSGSNKIPAILHTPLNMAKGSLPDDLVEISEEEAFDIVQKGLLNFKTKRAN